MKCESSKKTDTGNEESVFVWKISRNRSTEQQANVCALETEIYTLYITIETYFSTYST